MRKHLSKVKFFGPKLDNQLNTAVLFVVFIFLIHGIVVLLYVSGAL